MVLGSVWRANDEYDIVIADCNEAVQLNPSHARAFNCCGNAGLEKGEYDTAIADHNEALRLDRS